MVHNLISRVVHDPIDKSTSQRTTENNNQERFIVPTGCFVLGVISLQKSQSFC